MESILSVSTKETVKMLKHLYKLIILKTHLRVNIKRIKITIILGKHKRQTKIIVFWGCGSTLLKIYPKNGLLHILEKHILSINEPRGLTFDGSAKMERKYKTAQLRILNKRSYLILFLRGA